MKKFFILAVVATMCVSCGNKEFNEVNAQYEEIAATKVSAAKDENKKDPNFRIFNDHFQKGKGQTK